MRELLNLQTLTDNAVYDCLPLDISHVVRILSYFISLNLLFVKTGSLMQTYH